MERESVLSVEALLAAVKGYNGDEDYLKCVCHTSNLEEAYPELEEYFKKSIRKDVGVFNSNNSC